MHFPLHVQDYGDGTSTRLAQEIPYVYQMQPRGIYEWSACEGEDEVIANKFADLHICTKGEIVQIVKDDSLTIGIVVDYCHDGFYDMWVWNKNQECSRERIPVSRVLYGLYFADETEIPDEEIRKELKKKLL